MIPGLLQFDQFATDAEQIRAAVIAGGFKTEKGPDGADYTGISLYPVPHWHERLTDLLGSEIVPHYSFFRLNLAGELPHSWVHSDNICSKWASVLYLNPPEQCFGGTAFWRHLQLGYTFLPSDEEIARSGFQVLDFHRWMTAEWKNLGAWDQYEMIPMQWNRFITYPTCFFHSRFPFEGFGQGAEDGRLIWVCFYDKVGES